MIDKTFNKLYNNWIDSNKEKMLRPSLDHKIPKSRGGKNTIENLHFMTWFENRSKFDMTLEEWEIFKIKYKIEINFI